MSDFPFSFIHTSAHKFKLLTKSEDVHNGESWKRVQIPALFLTLHSHSSPSKRHDYTFSFAARQGSLTLDGNQSMITQNLKLWIRHEKITELSFPRRYTLMIKTIKQWRGMISRGAWKCFVFLKCRKLI